MGFTKLDENILQSSIMAEKSEIFKVWIALLASCGPDGISRVSSVYLAAACHLPQKTVDNALVVLSSPDERSRSINDEGRRICRIDGGYFVINYDKYRAFSPNEGNPNSPGAIRVRRWREKQKSVTCPPDVTPGNVTSVTSASAYASSSASLEHKEGECEGENIDAEFTEFWSAYPIKEGKADALKAFRTLRKSGVPLEEIAAGFNGYMDYLKHERVKNNFARRPKLAATFLRNDRWKEFSEFKYKPEL
jgi:hypothetical protein